LARCRPKNTASLEAPRLTTTCFTQLFES
jgi:hypothetical protein